jgi:hypothetical protein
MVDIETVVLVSGVFVAIVSILIEHFHYNASLQERIKGVETNMESIQKCVAKLSESSDNVVELNTKVNLFWRALETQLPPMLLKGNPLASDSRVAILLTKFKENRIDNDEIPELVKLIDAEIRNPEHTPGEILAMVLLNVTLRSNLEVSRGKSTYRL